MYIKIIDLKERSKALKLVLATFMKYEAPDYSQKGIETFKNSVIYNDNYLNTIVMYGAYEGDILQGVIATRKQGTHIALFFVDGKYHRQGIGRKLFEIVLENSVSDKITVNSSPYAVDVYHHLGFTDTDSEQIEDGMRYTPMVYEK